MRVMHAVHTSVAAILATLVFRALLAGAQGPIEFAPPAGKLDKSRRRARRKADATPSNSRRLCVQASRAP